MNFVVQAVDPASGHVTLAFTFDDGTKHTACGPFPIDETALTAAATDYAAAYLRGVVSKGLAAPPAPAAGLVGKTIAVAQPGLDLVDAKAAVAAAAVALGAPVKLGA